MERAGIKHFGKLIKLPPENSNQQIQTDSAAELINIDVTSTYYIAKYDCSGKSIEKNCNDSGTGLKAEMIKGFGINDQH